jgi:isoleucyl-tRNA synthetase
LKNGKKRRSAQTVLYELTKKLALILSPVLSFTTEEVWRELFGEESIFLADFPVSVPENDDDKKLLGKFEKVLEVRDEFHKVLEAAQEESFIGNSLEAKVLIKSDLPELKELKNYLKEIFIVSEVSFVSEINSKYSFEGKLGSYGIEKAEGEKCSRCWMFSVDVGKDSKFEALCERCIGVIKGGDFELED